MANITEKISKLFPQAVIEGDTTPQVTIPAEQWHDLALTLRDDPDMKMDFLITIVGMDWKENGLGAIYYMMSTQFNNMIGVRIIAQGDRSMPTIPSAADVWKVATLFELLRNHLHRQPRHAPPFPQHRLGRLSTA